MSELNLNTFFSSITETTRDDNKLNIDYTDLSYGYTVDTHGDFLIAGAPILSTSPSENQSGRASFKYNSETQKHDLIKNFIVHLHKMDWHTKIEMITVSSYYQKLVISYRRRDDFNDDFGKSVSIHDTICAIGSPMSHINGKNTDQPTGHIFVYEKTKVEKRIGESLMFLREHDSKFRESVCVT